MNLQKISLIVQVLILAVLVALMADTCRRPEPTKYRICCKCGSSEEVVCVWCDNPNGLCQCVGGKPTAMCI